MIDTLDIAIEQVEKSRINQVDFDNIPFGRVFSDHMYVANYKNGEWGEARIVPYQPMQLSPANSAIHYGQSIFEGMKAYRNDKGEILIFRPLDNFRRLNKSAERMCMAQLPEEAFMNGLSELLRLDQDWVPSKPNTALYIRPFMFAMDDYIGIRASDTYQFMIFTCPVGSYYNEPVKVKIETHYSRAVQGGTGAAKAAGNYAASLFPARQAQQQGYHQLVWTDAKTHQYIEESGTMNVMFVIDDTLITTPTSDTILAGITRDSVLTLARDWGIKVEERRISVKEVEEAIQQGRLQEAFGTGTAATIANIAKIGIGEKQYTLPEVNSNNFSKKVFKALDDIKTGRLEDKWGWIYKV
jgi:branched-chain amino acid aminotransferase